MSNLPNFPILRPSLLLDFANSKSVDPRITFTRASTATYFDAQGVLRTAASGVPRIDHDPVTGECKGLLIEEARTNLLTYSEQFDNAAWTKAATTVTPNAATAPDGALTADFLAEDSSAGIHSLEFASTLGASTSYAMSCYFRAGSRSMVRLAGRISVSWLAFPEAVFDLTTGTVLSSKGDRPATIEALPGGWYRCTIYGTTTASGTNAGMIIGLVQSGTAASYTGDGVSGAYVWGAQLE